MADTLDRGPNDWLIDEMRARWIVDPGSVSESWATYFQDGDEVAEADSPQHPDSKTTDEPESPDRAIPESRAVASPAEKPALPRNATPLRGISGTIAQRMDESLAVPTATSFRVVPSKLLEVNRLILNNQLKRLISGGKVSFTHLIGYAVVRAVRETMALNVSYAEIDDAPHVIHHEHVNFGLAIDIERGSGERVLLVPNIKAAEGMDFKSFWAAYEDLVDRTRANKLSPDDFAGTTVSLTNPGTIGTIQSVPRLMAGQGLIIGVGAIGYPPQYEAADPRYLARHGIGRTITLTSTYDHRVIQGAQSGELLRRMHELLLGEDEFYDRIFDALDIPYTPARWAVDDNPPQGSSEWSEKQANVFQMINAYRVRGHLIADLDPLRQKKPTMYKELDPLHYGLTIWDLDREFATGGISGKGVMPLGQILSVLRNAYCRTVGIEYMHMQETDQKRWLQERLEGASMAADKAEKLRILRKLEQAEGFEKFLQTKFVGQKRFGLEGSESAIPLIDALLGAAAGDGISEAVFGMAHRGRLNVLVNVIGKSYERVFREFEGEMDPESFADSGDVKYHLGASGKYDSENGSIEVQVVANPSHLEAVDPVLEGVVRAKQERVGKHGHERVLPILIHGDAAFAGQGVVVETLNLSQLRGYRTGGTVHVIINNQVGFTTSTLDARSSFYATDVAKTVAAPIIHVNGDDPEAVVRVARLAFEFRQAFKKDVVVDMICYRRRGHNEGDEPSYTQPVMYKLIDQHRSVRNLYMERLISQGDIADEEAQQLVAGFQQEMDRAFQASRDKGPTSGGPRPTVEPVTDPVSAVAREELSQILAYITTPPEGLVVHPKLERMLEERRTALTNDVIDWGTAEALAFGSLAREGVPVRLAGEDSRRGTFSHRHAELTDYTTGQGWIPLQTITEGQTRVRIVDSLLSEFAAVGFEYGYSIEWPEALVMWEAQFGDFANGAQVIIDQFIAPGESKWGERTSLTLLLPHGYEGQGPEHSSARIERFLNLCAHDNMRVVVPATSGQYFHLLRRQALLRPRKPLVVFTPKSLLRTKASFGTTADLTGGSFEPVVVDPTQPSDARRVVLCTGKVFHDLTAHREANEIDGVAIVRVPQLFPVPEAELSAVAGAHAEAELVWCQEEPQNMGAYGFIWHELRRIFGREARYAGRSPAASPATGSLKRHLVEQAALVAAALD
ncbi:MAG TPA: multifunctional oxoglutarate decarboxylase/oxoglutarate dehydrogenase thiamine pyrophosphate-binding subunit/dihydrolipoyllysine-residue succinyltransferase subunit [Acidimicrobiia bacterium]|nr:multifunctional oxoglutarate decarboxylase/oxoglutarate dehydrogenase thiamine pyrophosphate-binding subunit/dihydrolipoyllysine-residue succinyltransferase subunit [Acidimicrobiia bacterium]